MGRPRTRDKHLPRGVYLKHGAYYLVRYEGDRKRWTRLGTTYAESLSHLSTLLACASPTMDALIARYELERQPKKARTSVRNEKYRLPFLRKVFGKLLPSDIEPHHVWEYWRERGEGPAARHEVALLSAILTFGRQVGMLTTPNPCYGLNLPGEARRERYVTDAEFLTVRSLAPPMVAHAMNLALVFGLDRSTILSLERRNVTEKGLEFYRKKTKEWQLLPWTEESREVVRAIERERPELRAALICNRKGKPYTADGFKAFWHRTMEKAVAAKVERFHFHDLRAKSGSDDETDQGAADRLGHRSVATTKRHYRRLPRVAAPLKMPRIVDT